jgi:hypothetical protein
MKASRRTTHTLFCELITQVPVLEKKSGSGSCLVPVSHVEKSSYLFVSDQDQDFWDQIQILGYNPNIYRR